ncbi:MAG: hypothetical protein H6Q89_4803 [Myxococcaceae bacterium]|nr:hypothetical protein [Myxococcaceae bacterium]
MALGAAPAWIPIKANGFSFEMPSKAELKTGPVTWPTTGQMTQTEWTSKLDTGDKQLDVLSCYESSVPTARLLGLMHDTYCKEDAPGQRRWDRTDPPTQARECLLLSQGADGKRRTLVKILAVEANVCVLRSSARIDKPTDEASPSMRRFVDSLKPTGKQTVVSATPWVAIKGDGFSFELPQKVEPKTAVAEDPKIGKFRSIKWKLRVADEQFDVLCMNGPKVTARDSLNQIMGMCGMAGATFFRTTLPNGVTECSNLGPPVVLLRFFPAGNEVCIAGAMREKDALSQSARRFVDSFVRTP